METREQILTDQSRWNETRKLLSKAELSIWLDTYDDIYSDFDSRPYSERSLSDDFINEAKKMAKEKMSGAITFKLLMPANQRVKLTEGIIVKSLHAHFHRAARILKEEMVQTRRRGITLTAFGLLIMIITAVLLNLPEKNFPLNALRIILEPAGWFLAWTGLDQFFYVARRKKPEFEFMTRMSHADIEFLSF